MYSYRMYGEARLLNSVNYYRLIEKEKDMGIEELLIGDGCEDSIYMKVIKENLDNRTIILNGDVTNGILEEISFIILKWNSEDKDLPVEKRKPITLAINSGGGDAVIGLNLIDVIQQSMTPVHTVVFGQASSMASYLLMAGDKRYAFKNSVILLHDGSSGMYTSSNKARDIQNFYDRLDSKIKEFVIDNTKMSEEYLEEIKDREMYLFAEEAKEFGIIDGVIGEDINLEDIF